MRVLVTGSSGRLGRVIAAALAPAHEAVGLDRVPGPATRHVGDLGDAGLVARALDGADALVHAAALHAPHVGIEPDAEFRRINVDASVALVEAAAARGLRRVVFTSTTALYGAGHDDGPAGWVDEDTPPRPRTIYHRSKLAAEAALSERAAGLGLALTILRVGRCFPEPAPAMAVYRLHRGIDARDIADAHLRALAGRSPGVRRFVVSGRTPFLPADAEALGHDAASVLRLRAPALAAAFDARGWRLPSRIDRVYDPARAMAALGWQPRHGPEAVLDALDRGEPAVLAPGVGSER